MRCRDRSCELQHTQPTGNYTLSLHDALPICACDLEDGILGVAGAHQALAVRVGDLVRVLPHLLDICPEIGGHLGHATMKDRKSTRLNSSHGYISYVVFCLKKKIASKATMRVI